MRRLEHHLSCLAACRYAQIGYGMVRMFVLLAILVLSVLGLAGAASARAAAATACLVAILARQKAKIRPARPPIIRP